MTVPGNPPRLPGPKYSSGQVAMMIIGGIMLLPGLCSVLLAMSMVQDLKNSLHDPIMQMLMIVWGICLAISVGGVILIVSAVRRARVRR